MFEHKIIRTSKKQQEHHFLYKYKNIIKEVNLYVRKFQIKKAMKILQENLQFAKQVDNIRFKGYGLRQNWNGVIPVGAFQWYEALYSKKIHINGFDFFNIIIGILLQDNDIQVDEALNLYEKLRKSLINCQCQFLVGLGNVYYYNESYLQSYKCFKKALQINPTQKIHQSLAWIQGTKLNLIYKALKNAQETLKLNEWNVYAKFLLAMLSQQQQKRIKYFEQIIKKYQQQYRRLLVEYGVYCFEDNYKQKLKYVQLATQQLDYKYAKSQKYIIMINYGNEIQRQQAKCQVLKIIQRSSFLQEFYHIAIANYYQKQKNYRVAINWILKLFAKNQKHRDNCKILKYISSLYYIIQQYHDVICYNQKYIQVNPYDIQHIAQHGQFLLKIKQEEKAFQFLQKYLKQYPQSQQIIFSIGLFWQQKKQYIKALQYYYKIFSKNQIAIQNIIQCLSFIQDNKLKIQWAQKYVSIKCNKNAHFYEFLGDLYFKNQKFHQSLENYLQYASVKNQYNVNFILNKFQNSKQLKIFSQKIFNQNQPSFLGNFKLLHLAKIFLHIQNYQYSIKSSQFIIKSDQLNKTEKKVSKKSSKKTKQVTTMQNMANSIFVKATQSIQTQCKKHSKKRLKTIDEFENENLK